MAWIKRNKFFVISMAVGLVLTCLCGYLFSRDLTTLAGQLDDYEQSLTKFKQLAAKPVTPSKTNITQALTDADGAKQVLAALPNAYAAFPPVPKVDEAGFKGYLAQTVSDLSTAATNAGVKLPPDGCFFGFTQQMTDLNFNVDNLEPWMHQLQETKLVAGVLFDAKVDSILTWQRVRVSGSDVGVGQDYFDTYMFTNLPQVSTPYKISFRAFSRELGDVLQGFARSSNCIIVKDVYVSADPVEIEPLPAASSPSGVLPGQTLPTSAPPPNPPRRGDRNPVGVPPGGGAPAPGRPGARPGSPPPPPTGPPVTVLSEAMLRVSISVDVVRLVGGGH